MGRQQHDAFWRGNGALFNGWLSFRLGRSSLMAGAILFVLGLRWGLVFASSVEVILIGARVILGVDYLRIPRRFISEMVRNVRAK